MKTFELLMQLRNLQLSLIFVFIKTSRCKFNFILVSQPEESALAGSLTMKLLRELFPCANFINFLQDNKSRGRDN